MQQTAGLSVDEVADGLEHRSGLAGSADMRSVLAAADQGESPAQLAVEVYVHRLSTGVAAMAASMDGLDALVFTRGVGENAPPIRQRAAARLAFLGVEVDSEKNGMVVPDADVSTPKATMRTLVINSREDIEIAHEVRRVLRSPSM